jgi:LPXTG-motif cell wall-anchored protein
VVSALGAGAAAGTAHSEHAANPHHRSHSRLRASLRVSDSRVAVGRKVLLDSSHSRGRVVYHLWDLDGDGVYETSTKRRARLHHAFDQPGSVRVGVVVMDRDGGYSVRRARVKVVEPERHHGSEHAGGAGHAHRGHVHAATKHKGHAKPARHSKPAAPSASSAPSPPSGGSPDLHAASTSSSVTISDFKFEPKSITVSVGTTVTWTNQGPTAHTATADDGTFDTGTLTKGATGRFTFNKAGTYKYHCTPHPFMKASVTVTGSGGSSSPDSSSSSSSSSSNGSGSSHRHSSLPHTGLEIASFVLAGLLLLGSGAAIRRRVARG